MHSVKQIPVGTPVRLRLNIGTEATGQIAFCKPSPSNDRLWGIGVVLDKVEPCRELDPANKDCVAGNDALAILLNDKGTDASVSNIPESGRLPDPTLSKAGVRESLTTVQQFLPKTLGRQIADGVEKALEQIEVPTSTLMRQAQFESEQPKRELRSVGDEIDRQVRQSVSAELERSQHQFREVANKYLENTRQEIANVTGSMREVSDQIYSALQKRLENEFSDKQEMISVGQKAIAIEEERLQAQARNVDDRIAKLAELAIQLEAKFTDRLTQTVSETTAQALTNLEQLLGKIQDEQLRRASRELESTLAPLFTRADSSIEGFRSLADILSHERDQTEIQIGALRQEKEGMQLWFAQQGKDFRKAIEDALLDAEDEGRTSVQKALDMIRDPVDKLTSEAKNRIEEVTACHYVELGKGVRGLRDQLAALQWQAGESLRVSLQGPSEEPK